MASDKWSDGQIENLLKDFPAIEDHRSKEEVRKRLVPPKKRQPRRWPAYVVAAVVLFAFGALFISMLSQNSSYDMAENSSDSSSGDSGEIFSQSAEETDSEDASTAMEESAESESEGADTAMMAEDEGTTAVYEENLVGFTPFTIGLTENAVVVPVTFLLPAEEAGAESKVDLYNRLAGEIDETALGFDEYHPYRGTLEQVGGTIEHTLPGDHWYDLASAAINVYIESLSATFSDAEAIRALDEDGTPAEFDQVGPMEIIPEAGGAAYYGYTLADGSRFLVPDRNALYGSAGEALSALAQSPNDLQEATVPDGAAYSVEETDEAAIVRFDSAFDLDALDGSEAMRMIESMALTAGSFGKQLHLENLVQSEWRGFDFTGPVKQPVAPNRMEWTGR